MRSISRSPDPILTPSINANLVEHYLIEGLEGEDYIVSTWLILRPDRGLIPNFGSGQKAYLHLLRLVHGEPKPTC